MKKIISIFLWLVIIFGLGSVASAAGKHDINSVVSDIANYLYITVDKPQIGSVGGEWAVLGLARSGEKIPNEYFENYCQAVKKYVEDCGGVLHNKKYTEYSRVVLALTSIGENPENVAGYNLLLPLGDYEKTTWQGVNGAIWALIALDSKNYEVPQCPDAAVQATREMYVNYILEKQTADGGWALAGDTADADVTGMALQALSKYQDNDKVKAATEKALSCLSAMQNGNGGFSSYDTENSESTVQVIVALCELGISYNDARFVKNGNTVLDDLMTYYDEKNGFNHASDGSGLNLMSTEQALYAVVAVKRMNEGKSSLYRMDDAISVSCKTDAETGNKGEQVNEKNIFDIFCGGKAGSSFQRSSAKIMAKTAVILYNVLSKPKLT